MYVCIYVCTTEALEIKHTASSVCLRRIVALCGLGVYVVRPGVYGVPSQQILHSARPSRAKTGFPAHSVVQTGYTIPCIFTKPPRGCSVTYIVGDGLGVSCVSVIVCMRICIEMYNGVRCDAHETLI